MVNLANTSKSMNFSQWFEAVKSELISKGFEANKTCLFWYLETNTDFLRTKFSRFLELKEDDDNICLKRERFVKRITWKQIFEIIREKKIK